FSRVIGSNGRVTATLENLPQRGGTSTTYPTLLSHLATLRTHVPNIKFTVDVGHCLQNDDPYDSFFRRHKNDVADIHLHDGVYRGSAHLAFGSGQLDVERFIRLLQDTDYGGFATLEMLSTEDTAR